MQKALLTIYKSPTEWLLSAILIAFVVLWPFSIKKLVIGSWTPYDTLNEFASFFFYPTDILATAFLLLFIVKYNKIILLSSKRFLQSTLFYKMHTNVPHGTFKQYFLLFLGAALLVALITSKEIAYFFNTARIALLFVFFITSYSFLTQKMSIVPRGTILQTILGTLTIIGCMHALYAVVQFLYQKSLGLSFVRESIIGVDVPGVAKIHILDHVFVRAYGLLPHPNVLAGFLIVTLAASIAYKSFKNVPRGTFLVHFAIFIQIIALLFTFSRSAMLAAAAACVMIAFYKFMKLFHVEQLRSKFAVMGIIIFVIVNLASLYVAQNASCQSMIEKSMCERDLYNHAAFGVFQKNPFFGSGMSITLSVDNYVDKDIFSWQYQPAHNIFLLILAENGIFLILMLICGLLWFLYNVPRGTLIGMSLYGAVIALVCVSAFDHYVWDINQGIISIYMALFLALISQKLRYKGHKL